MYLKIYLSSILFGFIFLCLAVLNYQQTNSYHGPKSNHFDGTHFFNMPPYHQHNMTDTLSDEAIDQPLIDLHQAKANQKLASDEFITLDVGQSQIYH
jgi:hypothetical protein